MPPTPSNNWPWLRHMGLFSNFLGPLFAATVLPGSSAHLSNKLPPVRTLLYRLVSRLQSPPDIFPGRHKSCPAQVDNPDSSDSVSPDTKDPVLGRPCKDPLRAGKNYSDVCCLHSSGTS